MGVGHVGVEDGVHQRHGVAAHGRGGLGLGDAAGDGATGGGHVVAGLARAERRRRDLRRQVLHVHVQVRDGVDTGLAGVAGAQALAAAEGGQVGDRLGRAAAGALLAEVDDDGGHAEQRHHQQGEEDEDEPLLLPRAGQETAGQEPAHCSNFAVAWLVSVTGILNRIPSILSPVLVIATCTRLPGSALPSL